MPELLIIQPKVAGIQLQVEQLRQESSKLYLQAKYMQFEERTLLLSLYETVLGKLHHRAVQIPRVLKHL